jgi:hypothetical protein
MTQRPTGGPVAAATGRVACPLRGGAAVDVERCFTCAYFNRATVCGTDPRELVYAGPRWWRVLIP